MAQTAKMEANADLAKEKAVLSFWDNVMEDMNKGKRFTEDDTVLCYDTWAKDGSYENSVDKNGFGALNKLEKTMDGLFPDDKDKVVLLDIGACTGFSGQRLYRMGFRTIDALDASRESLKVAEQKGVYRKLFNVRMTAEPLDISENSYDVAVLCGATGPKHLPLAAFTEIIRLVKPGGYIVHIVRADFLEFLINSKDDTCDWKRMVETHTASGKWRLLEEERYEKHFCDKAGYRHVFQILQ